MINDKVKIESVLDLETFVEVAKDALPITAFQQSIFEMYRGGRSTGKSGLRMQMLGKNPSSSLRDNNLRTTKSDHILIYSNKVDDGDVVYLPKGLEYTDFILNNRIRGSERRSYMLIYRKTLVECRRRMAYDLLYRELDEARATRLRDYVAGLDRLLAEDTHSFKVRKYN